MTKFITKKPSYKNDIYIKKFFNNLKINELKGSKDISLPIIKKKIEKKAYGPNLLDLYMLYNIILLNKRTTVLEFGSGWSSLIISHALKNLRKKYFKKIEKLRRSNPFELFILENENKFLKLTKKRLGNIKSIKIHFSLSDVVMTNYNNKFATEYKKLPLCNPDFIYLDGPDQFKVKKTINNFTTAHQDMMPMVCDILKMEYFLLPGTIMLVDGRGANASFLKNNFQRNWKYEYFKFSDQHLFTLIDKPIGPINKKLIQFYNSK